MTADAAGRLAQGRPSVANTQSYVAACHAVGYQHPDLTAHGAQILDWYGGQDGLDLPALDGDCAVLRAAAGAAEEALRIERDGCVLLAAAWQGGSGSRAEEFTDRHCAAGEAVAGALRAAAEACEALRDRLWQLVDGKVDAAVSIDDRRAGERPAWLTAAGIVTGGGAERGEAVEVVTGQITPYVDTDIRTEWVDAMRSATASAAAAFDDTVRRLSGAPAAVFEVPGPLAPGPSPSVARIGVAPAAMTVPSAAPAFAPAAPPPVAEPEPAFTPAAPPPEPSVPQPPPPAVPPTPPALGGVPSAGVPAMPDVAGGLSGLAGQIADALGGLAGTTPDAPVDDPVPDRVDDDVPTADDPAEADDPEPVVDEPDDAGPEAVPIAEPAQGDAPAGEGGQPVAEPAVSDVEPVELPPPAPPEPETAGSQTPCEIAADELPQVGQ